MEHSFQVASKPQNQRFSIYQTLGGGVAVLDYDLDGACDLYFAQGAADPPSFLGKQTNRLYRHADSTLRDVTLHSAATEYRYTMGVTSGDWNQDGFPDLVVANIGSNRLLINNGDGTFTSRLIGEHEHTHRVPASAAIADITGDGLPDIFQAYYIDDSTMAVKPPIDEKGNVLHNVSPNNFDPSPDWLIENDAAGGFIINEMPSQSDAGTGLGVIVTDFDGRAGNEVFVGNDSLPNHLWSRDDASGELSDVAALLGCAYGFTGGTTGAMGIAAGDFDKNGSLDLHVTNYENENSNLYLSHRGSFQDRNVQYKLGAVSKLLVGFGTQPIDVENDGRLDLVVTNGHIEDSLSNRGPFQQPLQLFRNVGDQFQLAVVTDASQYWSSQHVGRGLATLDFNRDGREDLVITHLGEPSALLLNQTPSENHWLQLELIGVESERDAVGARIRIRFGDQESTDWVIAGDGYLSHNEAVVSFGLGNASRVDEIAIHWPSGHQQIIRDVPADRRLLVIENQQDPFTFDAPP